MRQRNSQYDATVMRQRRNQEGSLELPQGRPVDDSNKKQSTPSKRRRKHHHVRVYLFFLRLLDYVGLGEVDLKKELRLLLRKIKQMTAVQMLVMGVGVTFVGLPLILFVFSERKVIKENAIHYDIYHCPPKPPADYPREYPILDVLHHWPTANLTIPESDGRNRLAIHKGICVFDLGLAGNGMDDISMRKQIQVYREKQVPFIVRNDQDVTESVLMWGKKDYLSTRLANKMYQATLVSKNDTTISEIVPMSFDDWDVIANKSGDGEAEDEAEDVDSQYAALRLDACMADQLDDCDAAYLSNTSKVDQADFIYGDLSFFRPPLLPGTKRKNKKKKKSPLLLYDILDRQSSGIQCQFASPGFLSETQLDDERGNYIAMLSGKRRYLLSHPRNCPSLYLYHNKADQHTYRSQIHFKNWTHHHTTHSQSASSHHHHHPHNHPQHPAFKTQFPDFEKTTMNEVVLEAGDVLYLPTHWIHHVVSLTTNYQCKTPSAHSNKYESTIRHCLK